MGLYKADTCSIKETNSVVRAGYRLTWKDFYFERAAIGSKRHKL